MMMYPGDSGTGIPCKPLRYSHPAVDREVRSDVLLVGDTAYPHRTAEQRGPCTSEEERRDEVDIEIWRDVK